MSSNQDLLGAWGGDWPYAVAQLRIQALTKKHDETFPEWKGRVRYSIGHSKSGREGEVGIYMRLLDRVEAEK